jgi:hypothetical protein
MYTDVALMVLSEADSLRSACELADDVRDLVMAHRVLMVHLVPFILTSLKIKKLSNLSRYVVFVRDVTLIIVKVLISDSNYKNILAVSIFYPK